MKRASKVLRDEGATWKRLHEALVDAFPSGLGEVVRFYLGKNLVRIAQQGNLDAVVHELMEWVVSRDVAERLIMGARLHNHTNVGLRECARHISSKMCGSAAVLPTGAPGQGTVDPSTKERLVGMLADHERQESPLFTLLLLLPQGLVDELTSSTANHPDSCVEWADKIAGTYASSREDVERLGRMMDLVRDLHDPPPPPPPPPGTNPYQKVGALPANSRSYVRRDCDLNLERALQSHTIIAVHGEFNIGKSSLLQQGASNFKARNGPRWTICTIDVQGISTATPQNAAKAALRKVGRCLNKKFTSWQDVGEAAEHEPLIILIDEFGKLKNQALEETIDGFHHLMKAHSSCVRIVIAMPREIQDFLGDLTLSDARFRKYWTSVWVDKFSAGGVDTLLDHLQPAARALTREHRAEIDRRVDGNPKPLQCLCFELFNAYAQDPSSDLRAIIYDPKSYE